MTNGLERGYDGHKKVKGHNWHVLVDTLGNLLDVVAANRPDGIGAKAVLSKIERLIARRLLKLWADKGYQSEFQQWLVERHSIQLDIVTPPPDQSGFAIPPRLWMIERTFAWLGQFRRLSKDDERCPHSSDATI